MQVGLAFLPANVIMAVFSVGLSAKLVTRFGVRLPLALGLILSVVGFGLFAIAPVSGHFAIDVLPGMLVLGLGAGIAYNPLLLAAMNDVDGKDSGLASGVANTSFMMGGALGLAALASLAALRTDHLLALGADAVISLNEGYHIAFGISAALSAVAALLCLRLRDVADEQSVATVTLSEQKEALG